MDISDSEQDDGDGMDVEQELADSELDGVVITLHSKRRLSPVAKGKRVDPREYGPMKRARRDTLVDSGMEADEEADEVEEADQSLRWNARSPLGRGSGRRIAKLVSIRMACRVCLSSQRLLRLASYLKP
jgi:hypothetical protein